VTSSDIAPLKQQIEVLWHMLQLRATWQPLFFLAFFNAFALHNSAWGNYLKTAYHFDAFQYGSMSAIGASVTFLGIYVYRYCIMNTYDHSWHQVYYFAGFIMCLFSILNILLVFNVNEAMGIPAFWFSIGDTAIISFAKGIQVLPLAIIFVAVCPQNQEGVAFALLTSITNLAHAFAYTISNILLVLWPVELPDLENHHYDGVWKLTLFTSVIGMIPLLFVKKLLPKTRNDLEELKLERSVLGARAVFGLYIFGFVWVTVLSILSVVKPCSVFVGGQGC
jgi:hypothetical protein